MSAIAPPLRGNPLYVINFTIDRTDDFNSLIESLVNENLNPQVISGVTSIPDEEKSFNIILIAHGRTNELGYKHYK